MEIDLGVKLKNIESLIIFLTYIQRLKQTQKLKASDSCAEAVEYTSIDEYLEKGLSFSSPHYIPFEAKLGYRNISLLGYSILKSGKLKLCQEEEIDIGGGETALAQITPYGNISISSADYDVNYNVFDYAYIGRDESSLSESGFIMPILGTWTSTKESAGKSQLLIVPIHVKFTNSSGVDLGEVDSTMRINFDFMSASKNKIDVAIKQAQITDLVGEVTGIDLDAAKERMNRRLNNRFGEIRTRTIIDKGLCIGSTGAPVRKIYEKKTIRYCEECIIETGMHVDALRDYYGDNFIVDRYYGEGHTTLGFDDEDPLRDQESETDCGSDMSFDMEIEKDTDSWKLQRRLHKWLVDTAIEDLLRGTERLRDFFKDRRVLWEMFERSK